MKLSEIMHLTAKEYGAKYYNFSQDEYASYHQPGLCHALCKVFLKRTYSRLYVEEFKHWSGNNEINLAVKQMKAHVRGYESKYISDIQSINLISYPSRKEFWEKVGELIQPFQKWDNFLCTFVSTRPANHVIATCIRDEFEVLFEPNGGVLKFKYGQGESGGFVEWIRDQLPRAPGYDSVQGIDRKTFDVRGGKEF